MLFGLNYLRRGTDNTRREKRNHREERKENVVREIHPDGKKNITVPWA